MARGLNDPSPNIFSFSAAELLREFKEIPDPCEAGSPQVRRCHQVTPLSIRQAQVEQFVDLHQECFGQNVHDLKLCLKSM